MGKGSRTRGSKRPARKPAAESNTRDLDDEIDAFHKQRDVVPLDVEATGYSDDDAEQPVFDFEEGEDSDEDNSDDNDDDEISYDTHPKGLAAKIARQAKYLQQKFGGGDDEMHDDTDEEEEKKTAWGGKKNLYYNADNVDYELQSSDEEEPMEEEAEVVKLQKERAKALSMEDFGLEDMDPDMVDTDGKEKIFKDAFFGKRAVSELNADGNFGVGVVESYEGKDLTALSKEEKMDLVYGSAPELVGLLSELNEALDEIHRVKPLLIEVKGDGNARGKMQHFEVKHVLLLAYCQAIGFYLLLKSEGHPVQDHPVIARLVEIKKLLEKMKQIDANLTSQVEEVVNHNYLNYPFESNGGESVEREREPNITNQSANPNDVNKTTLLGKDSLPTRSSTALTDQKKQESQEIQLGLQSKEMLKVKADLEAKLKLKGLYNLTSTKSEKTHNHYKKPINGRFETLDDFDDEVQQTAISHGAGLSKPSQSVANKKNRTKFLSGDEDLPKRDDIGERRRKHELRVLAAAGVHAVDDNGGDEDGSPEPNYMDVDVQETGVTLESEDEFYKDVKKQLAEKRMAKEELYSRTPTIPSELEKEADSKRQITYQMEKNRGLTRPRKKLTKNPRKKYKLKHQKAVIRRKGQVRDIRRPTGPYGGESTGINTSVSRSVRFKN